MDSSRFEIMRGRVCVITGASSGIGYATAEGLARLGASVVIASRSNERAKLARQTIVRATGNEDVEIAPLNLADLRSVRSCARFVAERHPAIHVLVNNAGIYAHRPALTPDGLESTFQTNHLGHFLFTNLLLPNLVSAAPSRIVNVASAAHRGGKIDLAAVQNVARYGGVRAYTQSKLANVMFTYELARRLEPTGVTVNAVHPGVVRTNWARTDAGWFGWLVRLYSPLMIPPSQGADTVLFAATSRELAGRSGLYLSKRKEHRSSPRSHDVEEQRRLFEESERLAGLSAEERARWGWKR